MEAATAASPYRVNPRFMVDYDESRVQVSRTLLELNARCGVGAMLDKRQWWIKSKDDTIWNKWIHEIKHGFVAKSILDVLSCWPQNGEKSVLYNQVREAARVVDIDARRQLLDAACRKVSYIDDWAAADDDYDEEREVIHYPAHNAYMTAALEKLEKAGTTNLPPVRLLYSYGQVAWYMHEWVHIQRVREIPVESLTEEQVDAVFKDDQVVAQRAADVVMAVCDGKLTLAGLREALGGAPDHGHDETVLLSIVQYIAMIHAELDDFYGYVVAFTNAVLMHPAGKSFASVQECFQSDELIPAELKNDLLRGVMRLEDVPLDQQDWHPHAHHQVLDLVHPSLYCGIYGVTKLHVAAQSSGQAEDSASVAMMKIMGRGTSVLTNPFEHMWSYRAANDIAYQWLPSEFEIDHAGKVHIRSYINNLHPDDHAPLYETIAQIFERFVPLFSLCLGSLTCAPPPRLIEDYRLSRLHRSELPPMRGLLPWDGLETPVAQVSLNGTTLQVIVKIAEIVLTPENPSYNGGSWHIEGTPVERIVATGIYYFKSENVTESKLAFRAQVMEPDYSQHDNLGVAAVFGLFDGQALAQNVGAVTTSEDRCLVFPNVLQHKVLPFELADKTKPGVRKILCFFLVDPSTKIPSTAQIPPQQREWISRVQSEQLQQTIASREIPDAVAGTVLDMAQEGLTREQAERYRLKLMEERSPQMTTEGRAMHFSLCEH